METISITYRGLVHKLTEYEKLADTIETIYAMCDQKITHFFLTSCKTFSRIYTLLPRL